MVQCEGIVSLAMPCFFLLFLSFFFLFDFGTMMAKDNDTAAKRKQSKMLCTECIQEKLELSP